MAHFDEVPATDRSKGVSADTAGAMAAPEIQRGDSQPPQSEHVLYFKVYEEYAKTLRTWLVAYGVGAPVLFVTNKDVSNKLAASHAGACIAELFLAGVGLQIFLAMVNKTVMWANYWSERNPDEAEKKRFRFASWVSSQYWIDFSIDVFTLLFFGAATLGAFRVLVAAV